MNKITLGGVWNSAVVSQPCPTGHITANKRLCMLHPEIPNSAQKEIFKCQR